MGQMTQAMRDWITKAHNDKRSVIPGAPVSAARTKMIYDLGIEKMVQNFIDTYYGTDCVLNNNPALFHNPYLVAVGENGYMGPTTNATIVVDAWTTLCQNLLPCVAGQSRSVSCSEQSNWLGQSTFRDLDGVVKPCNNGSIGNPAGAILALIGHTTQTYWHSSSRLGCGRNNCVFFCDYMQPGNAWPWYDVATVNGVTGTACSRCPTGFGTCQSNLCVLTGTPATTTTTLSVVNNGTHLIFTAQVTPVAATVGGGVSFFAERNSTAIAKRWWALNAQGIAVAAFSVNTFLIGSHRFFAFFNGLVGAPGYYGSTSAWVSADVSKCPTGVSWSTTGYSPCTTCTACSSYFRACTSTVDGLCNVANPPTATAITHAPLSASPTTSVTLTATVTSLYGTPTGSIQFVEGTTILNTVALAAGVASASRTFTSGSHSVIAKYVPTGTWAASTSAARAITILPATTTVITGSSTIQWSQAANITVQVTATGIPSGNVEIYDGTTLLTTQALVNGIVRYSNNLAYGTRTITAIYLGSTTFASSQGTRSISVTGTPTTITYGFIPNPPIIGQTLTIQVTVAAAAGTPTGNLLVNLGLSNSSYPLAAGIATIYLGGLQAFTYNLPVYYNGAGAFLPSTAIIPFTPVTSAPATPAPTGPAVATSMSFTTSPSPPRQGQAVAVTVTVTSTSGAIPTGTVIMTLGTTPYTYNLVNGKTVISLGALCCVGTFAFPVSYPGNSAFLASSLNIQFTAVASALEVAQNVLAPERLVEVTSAEVFTPEVDAPKTPQSQLAFGNRPQAPVIVE